jgi:hypothetical protein
MSSTCGASSEDLRQKMVTRVANRVMEDSNRFGNLSGMSLRPRSSICSATFVVRRVDESLGGRAADRTKTRIARSEE